MVRKQMMTYIKETNFPILNGINSEAEFSWSALLETMQSGLPNLFVLIQGAMSARGFFLNITHSHHPKIFYNINQTL